MQFDHQTASTYLKESEFKDLFTQALGWDNHAQTLTVNVKENHIYPHCNCTQTGYGSV